MTIPVLPGPWNFLAGAGGALGAYGQGMSQRHIYEQQQAQQNAQMLASLVAKGLVTPETLSSPENRQMFLAGGMPGIQPGQVEIPQTIQAGRRYGQELGAIPQGDIRGPMTVGVATQPGAQVEQAKGAEAGTTIKAHQGLTKPQAEVKAGIASAAAAPAIQGAQAASAEAQGAESIANKALWESIQKRLPKGGAFQNVAQYAAVHGLGWLTSLNEMYARLGSERAAENTAQIRLVTTIHNQASQQYKQYYADWNKGLEDEIKRQLGPLSEGNDLDYEEKLKLKNKITADYTKTHPQLGMDYFVKSATGTTYGATDESYDAAVRKIAGAMAGQENDKMTQLQTLYRNGTYTDAEIDNDPGLTAEEKKQIKSAKPSKPPK